MSTDLLLKPSCEVRGCGSTSDLYGSNCKHMTLCFSCGTTMAQNKAKCSHCDNIVTRLIREYNIRRESTTNRNYFIGKFGSGLPSFPKTKNPSQNKWSLYKDDVKPKPWILEEQRGQSRYQGLQECAQSASYYLLMKQGKEFSAVPAGSWYNFNKVAQYKQLTLEEAEEKMNSRQKTNQDGYKRWIMKLGNSSNNEEEEETTRKGDDCNEEGDTIEGASEDGDLHDEGSDKGSDWEHEEIFTDDDEAVGNPDEREDLELEATAAPPETKQDEDGNEEEVGLSESGRELKKLLGRSGGLSGIDGEEEEDEDEEEEDDMDEDLLPAPAAKQKEKRKLDGDEANKQACNTATKKMKTENEQKSYVRDNAAAASVNSQAIPSMNTSSASSLVSEEKIKALLMQKAPISMPDFINNFPERRKYSKEEKEAFTKIMKKISTLQKKNGISYLVLKNK